MASAVRSRAPARVGAQGQPARSRARARCASCCASRALTTVCEEARCPNLGECFSRGTATFMLLGDRCTRRCGYCSVATARPLPPDPDEPARVAEAAARLGLRYVVLTAVARDDLQDGGAAPFAATVRAVRGRLPAAGSRCSRPTSRATARALAAVLAAGARRLQPQHRDGPAPLPARCARRATTRAAWTLLRGGRGAAPGPGHQERPHGRPRRDRRRDPRRCCATCARAGVDIVTLGQYLRPDPRARAGRPLPPARRPSTRSGRRRARLGLPDRLLRRVRALVLQRRGGVPRPAAAPPRRP